MPYLNTDFYDDFHCTAERCAHNCCIGWEIDIDEDTLRKYNAWSGALGEKLKKNIEARPQPHFILNGDGRCPFLNSDNLCELILARGEDAICDICTEHPRFYNSVGDLTVCGLGLCCEEAGRLLAEHKEKIEFFLEGNGSTPELLDDFFALAELVQERERPLSQRIDRLLAAAGGDMETDMRAWAETMLTLERMDEAWTELLKAIRHADTKRLNGEYSHVYENILIYFLMRYVLSEDWDYSAAVRIKFCILSTLTICAADCAGLEEKGSAGLAVMMEHMRLYSSEIEYSDENVIALMEKLK